MKKSPDTLYRQWTLLSLIPRHPVRRSTSELLSSLINAGFDIEIRTLQRDLVKLSTLFTLSNDTEGKKNYWFWSEDCVAHEFPSMNPETALAFQLSKSQLTSTLPPSILGLLHPHMNQAQEVLNSTSSHLKGWPSKIAVSDNSLNLIKPVIDRTIQNVVYQGLLTEKQINITYKPRKKDLVEYTINPLGLVVEKGLIYLICTLWNYKNIVQLALHRFKSAELLEADAHPAEGFILASYVEKNFDYPISSEAVPLKVLFSAAAAMHLRETPLMEDQLLSVQADGRVLLEGNIIDSHKLRWWLAGFGSHVEVVAPASLRDFFAKEAQLMLNNYSK